MGCRKHHVAKGGAFWLKRPGFATGIESSLSRMVDDVGAWMKELEACFILDSI
jgi:hypothetical protein